MDDNCRVEITQIQSIFSNLTTESEPNETNKPRDYLLWSIANMLCCWLGFFGIFCSLPALVFSCQINMHLELDDWNTEKLMKYSKLSKLLNIFASMTYTFFLVCLLILVAFFIYELLILF